MPMPQPTTRKMRSREVATAFANNGNYKKMQKKAIHFLHHLHHFLENFFQNKKNVLDKRWGGGGGVDKLDEILFYKKI